MDVITERVGLAWQAESAALELAIAVDIMIEEEGVITGWQIQSRDRIRALQGRDLDHFIRSLMVPALGMRKEVHNDGASVALKPMHVHLQRICERRRSRRYREK